MHGDLRSAAQKSRENHSNASGKRRAERRRQRGAAVSSRCSNTSITIVVFFLVFDRSHSPVIKGKPHLHWNVSAVFATGISVGVDLIAAFYGCLYAGVIPVTVRPPHPQNLAATLPTVRMIIDVSARKKKTTHTFVF